MSPDLKKGRRLPNRAAQAAFTLLLVLVLVSLIFDPDAQQSIDPARIHLGLHASENELGNFRTQHGLSDSFLQSFWNHLIATLTFDWGESLQNKRPVNTLILPAIGPTLAYALPGFICSTVFALLGGAFLQNPQTKRKRWLARLLLGIAILIVSTSSILWVILGQKLASTFSWIPLSWPAPGIWVLPALLWMLLQIGPDLLHYRALFQLSGTQSFLQAMSFRGFSKPTIFRALLRMHSGAIIVRSVHRLPYLLVGSAVLEFVFNIPGIGRLIVDAFHYRDLPMMRAMIVLLTLFTVLIQWAGDHVASKLDPRLKGLQGE